MGLMSVVAVGEVDFSNQLVDKPVVGWWKFIRRFNCLGASLSSRLRGMFERDWPEILLLPVHELDCKELAIEFIFPPVGVGSVMVLV
jgi:hypothetical protein